MGARGVGALLLRAGILAFVLLALPPVPGSPGPPAAAAQVSTPPRLSGLHEETLARRVEGAVHRALLAEDEDARDAHVATAVELARGLAASYPESADAWYWLAVALGVRTEYSGPVQKLSTGPEVLDATVRVLELDSLHAGGHEMMGRLHAAVMRLPWLIRQLALRMGLGDALGDASWALAEHHYRVAGEEDPTAVAPRLELAKLLVERDRPREAVPVLEELTGIDPDHEVDRRMLAEADSILWELEPEPGG